MISEQYSEQYKPNISYEENCPDAMAMFVMATILDFQFVPRVILKRMHIIYHHAK